MKCPECGNLITPPLFTFNLMEFCSDKCENAWDIRNNPDCYLPEEDSEE